MTIDARQLDWDLELPEEDRAASPLTGLTRDHWERVADDLLLAVRRWQSPQGGRFDMPGPPSRNGYASDGLEGFARTFSLAGFRVRGAGGDDPHGHLDAYRRGLVAGTAHLRPGGHVTPGESWQGIGDISASAGQPMVESADVAIGLGLTEPWLWDTLDTETQDAVETWLRGAIDHEPAPNNWYLFPLMVAGFLESVGRGDAATRRATERGLELLDSWYVGDGWYRDGDLNAFDHYIGWTMHLYPLLYAWLWGERSASAPAGLLEKLSGRLGAFLSSYAATFGSDGAPLFQGRSLTYRTATLSAVAMGAVTGAGPLAPGAARALCSRTLTYFLEGGATSRGLFSLGWHGVHPATVQVYSGPGSPYWASHGFAGLLLPADNPFWADAEEEPFTGASSVTVPSIGWVVQRSEDGVVRVHNHGSDHMTADQGQDGDPDVLYSRLAYSTITGPTRADQPSDNDVQLEYLGRQSVRRRFTRLVTGDSASTGSAGGVGGSERGDGGAWAASSWRPMFPGLPGFDGGARRGSGSLIPGAWIDVLSLADGQWDVRLMRFRHVPASLPVRASGWALTCEDPTELSMHVTEDGTGVSVVRTDGLVSELRSVGHASGAAPSFTTALADRAPGGTAFGPWALVPDLRGVTSDGVASGAGSVQLLAVATRLATDGVVTGTGGAVPFVELAGTSAHIAGTTGSWSVDWSGLKPGVTS